MSSSPQPGIAPRMDAFKFKSIRNQIKKAINLPDKARVKTTLESISHDEDLIEMVTTELFGPTLIQLGNDEFMNAFRDRQTAEALVQIRPKARNSDNRKHGKKSPKVDDATQALMDAKQRAEDIGDIIFYLTNAANGKRPDACKH